MTSFYTPPLPPDDNDGYFGFRLTAPELVIIMQDTAGKEIDLHHPLNKEDAVEVAEEAKAVIEFLQLSPLYWFIDAWPVILTDYPERVKERIGYDITYHKGHFMKIPQSGLK